MSQKNLLTFLIALVIVLAVILWIVAAKFVTRQKVGTPQSIHAPAKTKTGVVSVITSKVENMMKPVAMRRAEEKAKASEQFGAALERAGIATQAEASH